MRGLIRCYLALTAFAWPQSYLPSLADTKQNILQQLSDLPNYVCTETIEQSRRARAKPFDPIERFRLEVAYVGGKEFYGWPGAERIADEDVTELIGGTVASGDLGLMAHSLFTSASAAFTGGSEERRNGRMTLRYDYRVPLLGGDWHLIMSGREALVGYHGSFRVHRDSPDLELDATADDIPRSFGVKAVDRTLNYARVRIGSSDRLLPKSAVLLVTDRKGGQTKSEVRFENCRRYTVETSVHFDDPAIDDTSGRPNPTVTLPEEFEAEVTLENKIDSDTDAVGDLITARLQRSIDRGAETVIPAGAVLNGRITRLPLIDGHRYVDFRFRYFDLSGVRVDIRNRKNEVAFKDERVQRQGLMPTPIPGQGARVRLPSGFRLFVTSRANQ